MNTQVIELEIIGAARATSKVQNIEVTLDSRFREDLKLDSLSITELVITIEDLYNIEIDMDHPDVANAKTLRSLYDAVILLTNHTD